MKAFTVKRLLLVMALLDVLVFGGWIAREELLRTGELVELPVTGYDPRDLLSGHYVQFRLVAERETEALLREDGADRLDGLASPEDGALRERVSVCLERGEGGMHHVTHVRGEGEACPFITGTREPYRFVLGVDRFFVDERRAGEVSWVPEGPTTYLVATIDAAGVIHPVDLVVDGKSLGRGGR